MRVCHLSWEYPPVLYGGLGRHVHALAEAQAALGHDVTVITQSRDHRLPESSSADAVSTNAPATGSSGSISVINGVRVVRVDPAPPSVPFDSEHLLAWVLALNHGMTAAGIHHWPLLRPDVLHAHDWLVAHATLSLAERAPTTVMATIHATEAGRHQGWLPSPLSRSIHDIEQWLVDNADGVIACSAHMDRELTRLFDVPADRLAVIPNGVTSPRRRPPAVADADGPAPRGPRLVFCGRLEWEKGVHTLIDALPALRRRHPGIHVVIAGDGSQQPELLAHTRRRRVSGSVRFTGWLPEAELQRLMATAAAVVVPSIYEPFGLVALEAASLGTPVIAARTGGLAEFIGRDATGYSFRPGEPADLARAVSAVLDDPAEAARRARSARRRIRADHSWPLLAARTVEAYRDVQRRGQRAPISPPTPTVHDPGVNLLTAP